jgi:hypothetical protein
MTDLNACAVQGLVRSLEQEDKFKRGNIGGSLQVQADALRAQVRGIPKEAIVPVRFAVRKDRNYQ